MFDRSKTKIKDAPVDAPPRIDSIILLVEQAHGPRFLSKFMIEHGFVRCEELESLAATCKRYRLYRK